MYKFMKVKKVRIVSSVIAAMFMVTALMTGCGKSGTDESAKSSISTITDKTAEDTVKEEVKLDPYTIKWHIDGAGQQADIEEVQNEMNKILNEKINASIEIIASSWGDYDKKMQTVIASGEEYDLCFTSNWANNYAQNVIKGAFLELDDLLPQHGPTILQTIPAKMWEAQKVNGKTYGILNYQIYARSAAVSVRKDLADKYAFDVTKVSKLQDMEPFYENIIKNEKGMKTVGGPLVIGETVQSTFDHLINWSLPGAVKLNDPSGTVVNQFETEEYKNLFKLVREWYNKGYIAKEDADNKNMPQEYLIGKYAAAHPGTYKPGGEADEVSRFGGKEVYVAPMGKPVLTTSGIIATMTAVSRTSKDPARAVMFYDLLYKDKNLYNTLCFGIENKHYKKISENTIELVENSGYNPNTDWMFGNQFNAYIKKGQNPDVWQQTIKMNETADASPVLGFVFDQEPVKTEIAAVKASTELLSMLVIGSLDVDKYYPQFIERMKKAGADKIIAEMQKQVDQWKSTK